jgi:O-acetyl-ADP-ribose deacetylase
VITSAGKLPCNWVIHTVGPVWRGGNNGEDELLATAYRNSLRLCAPHNVRTIAFPNISTGIYGFPKGRAAEIACREVQRFIDTFGGLDRIVFCCFDDENYKIYKSILERS